MRSSLVHHFKSLISQIHPPLPLKPRESQKLLSLLKTTYKKQLDEKHPESSTGQNKATDAHFHALLSSPLFNMSEQESTTAKSRKSTQQSDTYGFAQLEIHRLMGNFISSVAAGTMTLPKLLALLLDVNALTAKLSIKGQTALLEWSVAGEKIRHWLWASGNDESKEFLENRRFAILLAPLLVHETHEKFLWKWVNSIDEKVLHSTKSEHPASRIQGESAQGHLIRQIVKRRMLYGAGASDACSTFLTIYHQFRQEMEISKVQRKLCLAGMYLHGLIAKDAVAISPTIFEAFVASCNGWGETKEFKARLLLHHPQGPRPDYAMRLLHRLSPQEVKVASRSKQYTILRLALETATITLKQEDYVKTAWLMAFAREHFPDETKLPSEVTPWSKVTSTSDVAQFASTIEELVLPISTALRLRSRGHASHYGA